MFNSAVGKSVGWAACFVAVLIVGLVLAPAVAEACGYCSSILQAELSSASQQLKWCYDSCESGSAGNACRADCYADYKRDYDRAVDDYWDCVEHCYA